MFSKIKDAALANAFISSSGLPHLRCPYHPDQSQRAAGQLISLFATLPIRCFLSDVERKPERRQSVSNYVESPPRMCCGGQKKTKRKKKENNLPFNRMTDMMVRGDREENDGASSLAVRRKTRLGALWGSESPRGHPPCPQPSCCPDHVCIGDTRRHCYIAPTNRYENIPEMCNNGVDI